MNSSFFILLTGASVVSPDIPIATDFEFIYNRFEKSFEGCDSDYYNKYIKETDELHHLE